MPNYVNNIDFKNFIDEVQPTVNANFGYMFILLEKNEYVPGQIIKGSVFFELFHISFQTKLMLKFDGIEIIPKRMVKKVKDNKDDSKEESPSIQSLQKNKNS